MDMLLFISVPLIATPLVVAIAWWLWRVRDRGVSAWRATALLVGLAAVTGSGLTYYGWLAYRITASNAAQVFSVKDFLADNVGIYLAFVALACAVLGKGGARIPVGTAAVMEVLLWSNFGVL